MELNSLLTEHFRLTEYQKKALKKLGIKTAKELLWHFPSRYEEMGEKKTIADLEEGVRATIIGRISKIDFEKTWKKKINIAHASLDDGTGMVKLVWFHQPFVANLLKEGDSVQISGKVQKNEKAMPDGRQGFYFANPEYEKAENNQTSFDAKNGKAGLLAIYPETRGLSSKWFRIKIQTALKKIDIKSLPDPLEKEILNKYHLPSLKDALVYIHTPKDRKNAEAARKRFSFEEIFFIQISRQQKRKLCEKLPSFEAKAGKNETDSFVKNFSFPLTKSQQKAAENIINDFKKGTPMARLLEGDVGSGKTAVAAIATYIIFKNKLQTAYMAPTEILARQIFESFIKYFSNTGAKIGLLTSSDCRKFPSKIQTETSAKIPKSKMFKWISEGELDIIIGTHSLIQDKVKFSILEKEIYKDKKLALVIIDEQHRFGTNQRAALINKKNESDKNRIPHFLSMTATPIPRTLALTVYGDLDLTLLDEMPPGRKKIETEIVAPNERENAYEKIREEIKKGRQAYVICPRIEPSEEKTASLISLNMRAVKDEYEKLSEKIFPEFIVGMLHGKMQPKEKEEVMEAFEKGEINILVATSVIEVGVNVPNATVIIIEGAERFGLAQLHQLRGRVLRSTYQPYCFVFTESGTQKTLARLKALKTAKNGFELAEYDLEFRGPGELSGKKQWGISDVGMEALKNIKMVEAAREEAKNLLSSDSDLKKCPLIKERLEQENLNIHFE
ncbi:MAG: ATP-dependent DNA helicase RecG [Candidatus Pacebacteria bacterium]|nr:ATP-dependent DNA helicase RecG [Candidatus Paceibacterota bacterium]